MSHPNIEPAQDIIDITTCEAQIPNPQPAKKKTRGKPSQGEPTTEGRNDNPFTKKPRKLKSEVWNCFKPVTLPSGEVKLECIFCKTHLSKLDSGTTTHLKRHMDTCCARRNQGLKGQQNLSVHMTMTKSEAVASIQNFQYNQSKIREIVAHMIIVHELPFRFTEYDLFNLLMKTATPHFQKISRAMAKKDCVSSYEIEKKKLMEELKLVKKVSLTTDLWKSDQNISYMVITCHYVDSNWNLQKRTLNFCSVPPPHTGLVLSDVLQKCLVEWGIEKKVWTITVDNASNNDVAVRDLKENLSFSHPLPLGGKIFHVRCCAHILNLLVQDGLSAIQPTISKVRESVKYVTNSEARVNMFSEIAKQLQLSSKKLVLDCCTRWNATYSMLSSALEFKAVFPRFQLRDALYTSLSSEEEWEKVGVVCSFLEDFKDITELISGSEYPTSNLFLPHLIDIKKSLSANDMEVGSGNAFMQEMVVKMKTKFDKYWGSCNLLISLAAALDPRNKMKYIDWCARNVYSELAGIELKAIIKQTLRDLYDEYVEDYKATSIVSNASDALTENSSISTGNLISNGRKRPRDYDSYTQTVDSVDEVKSELDLYLEETVVVWKDAGAFDVISWWKLNRMKFRILSRMACDVLSIPITSVASESAFSAGGRVIEPHRASLAVETVQMLLCAGDWLRAHYGIKGKNKDDKEDVKEIYLT